MPAEGIYGFRMIISLNSINQLTDANESPEITSCCENESAVVHASLELIKFGLTFSLFLNRHDTLIFKLQKLVSKAKITNSKLVVPSDSARDKMAATTVILAC
jgi:hypothetical protein